MKKLKKSISTYLPRAKIFLDDVEKIEEILRESCSSYNIPFNKPKSDFSFNENEEMYTILEDLHSFYTIKLDDEYELYSINEIKEIEEKQDFTNLEIMLRKPYFRLEFDEFHTHIYCDDDSLCLGIIERIKPIILKRKTYFQLSNYLFIYLVGFLLAIVLSIDVLMNLYSDLIGWILIGISILWNIITVKLTFFKDDNSKMIVFTTIKSNEKTNFFIKNKDQLILTSISATIIALLGTFLKFILTGQ
jgi:hypothetical protein